MSKSRDIGHAAHLYSGRKESEPESPGPSFLRV
jgi:hypothetical protein